MEPRRVASSRMLWRISGWVAILCLSWPLLLTLSYGPRGIADRAAAVLAAFAVALLSWVMIRRMPEAPERRSVVRPEPAVSVSRLTAALALLVGPIGLGLAWWNEFDFAWPRSWLALAPALGGGALALWLERRAARTSPAPHPGGELARGVAGRTFQLFLALERRTLALLTGPLRAILAASRDLHTGDAQEYLLFLAGVSVLALLISVLR
jgi:hypothetical protein